MTEEDKIEEAARAVAPLWRQDGLTSVLRVARIVRTWLHGENARGWPAHGSHAPSLRKLARHPMLERAELSYATLRRAMLVLELIERRPDVSVLKHSLTQLWMVAGLSDDVAVELLTRAHDEEWRTNRLATEARPHRRGGGRPPEPALPRALSQIMRVLDQSPAGTFVAALTGAWHPLRAGSARYWAREIGGAIHVLGVAQRRLADLAAQRPEVLLVDLVASRARAVAKQLEAQGYSVRVCRTPKQALALREVDFECAALVAASEQDLQQARDLGEALIARYVAAAYVVVQSPARTDVERVSEKILTELRHLLQAEAAAE
jgi:hypothetical protein